jgi:hypothetical protein
MRYQDLLRRVKKQPFRPFRVHVSDGAIYEVRHPDLLMVGRRMAVIGIQERADASEIAADTFAYVDVIHITQLTDIKPSKSAS